MALSIIKYMSKGHCALTKIGKHNLKGVKMCKTVFKKKKKYETRILAYGMLSYK